MQILTATRRKRLAVAHRLLRRVVNVRPREMLAMLSGFAYFFFLLSGYYLLRPLRDAMGIAGGGAGQLQWLFTATFLSMLAIVPLFGMIAARWPPRRFVPFIYWFFALNMLVFGAFFASGLEEAIVSRVFFVWISVYNLFVVSIFWSVLADHFSSEQGRRLFGFIAAGGTAGALAGPALAALLVVKFGVTLLTVLAAIFLECAVQCYRALAGTAPQQASSRRTGGLLPAGREDARLGGGVFAGIGLILRDRYLLGIVMFVLLHALTSTFLYFEQARIVAASLADTASRTRLFAMADLATSVLTIGMQLFITGRFMRRLGIAAALVLLPLVSLLSFASIAVWPVLLVLVLMQSSRRAIDYAIVRPAREVLFTVVSREAKYKAKSVIETVVYRGGDAAGGWIVASLAAAGIGFSGMAMIAAPFAVAWMALSAWLARQQERSRAFASRPPAASEPAAARTRSQPLKES